MLNALETLAPIPAPIMTPGIWRRIATIPYEGLLLLALLLIASFPVAGLKGYTLVGVPHLFYQAYLFMVTSAYFIWLWCHGGQTLPMKTWRFAVVDQMGHSLTATRATIRFICALIFFGPAAVGMVLLFFPDRVSPVVTLWTFLPLVATIWWAKFDPESQFLHDRLAGTRLINTPVIPK